MSSLPLDRAFALEAVRVTEAARQIRDLGKSRTLAHSTSGPCLQQNLVCVMEGGD